MHTHNTIKRRGVHASYDISGVSYVTFYYTTRYVNLKHGVGLSILCLQATRIFPEDTSHINKKNSFILASGVHNTTQ